MAGAALQINKKIIPPHATTLRQYTMRRALKMVICWNQIIAVDFQELEVPGTTSN